MRKRSRPMVYRMLVGFLYFSCDQSALWMVQSVRLSVCHTFLTMLPSSYHHEIYYQCQKWFHTKGQGHSSKVKVTEVITQLSCFRTVTSVWIHLCWWNDAQSLMLLRRGALLILAATQQLYEWYFPSVRLSVCLSVCLSNLFHHAPIILSSWKFQEILPMT